MPFFTITNEGATPFNAVFKGREEWALELLIRTGSKGCTPMEEPTGPRWAAYVHKLRKAGVGIETRHEPHGGEYRDFVFHKGPTPEMWAAMRAAVRVPDTMPEALAAYQAQEALSDARCAFEPCYNPWESAWASALEYLLDRLRTPTAEGIAARLDWMDILANRESTRGIEADKALIAALRDDFATFAASVQTGQAQPPTGDGRPKDRAAAVRDLLATSPRLSDREIARRVGCSPKTVGNWRKRMAA